MDFKGFDDWIEIFRGGPQTDSQGRQHDGNGLIDNAVATFDASAHEPPVVVGHPKTDSPAFGWVKGVRRADRDGVPVLEAKIDQVAGEFETAVSEGRYKKRSAAFFPDGRLRHVGFLGGAAPAVAGLRNIAFEDDGAAIVFESPMYQKRWAWQTLRDLMVNLREWLLTKHGKTAADAVVRQSDIDDFRDYLLAIQNEGRKDSTVSDGMDYITSNFNQGEGKKMELKDILSSLKTLGLKAVPEETANGNANGSSPPNKTEFTHTDADVQAKIDEASKAAAEEAAKKAKEEAAAEFAAQQEKDKAAAEAQARRTHIEATLKGLVEAKKVNPADMENLKTLAFAAEGLTLEGQAATIAFACAQDKPVENHPPVDWMLHILAQRSESPLFGEFATKDTVSPEFSSAEDLKLQRKMAGIKEDK